MGSLGTLDLGGTATNSYVDKHGLYKTIPLINALVDLYMKSGNKEKAPKVFESMKHKSIMAWTTMIAGFALHEIGNEAHDTFHHMERE